MFFRRDFACFRSHVRFSGVAHAMRSMIDTSYDLETWLIRPGLPAPRIVCGAVAEHDPAALGEFLTALEDRRTTLASLREILQDPEGRIVGANIAYDFGCACAADPDLLPLVFAAYDAGRVYDILLAQALIDIAEGMLFFDRVTNTPFRGDSEEGASYHQAYLEQYYLGKDRSSVKYAQDAWRLRYAELDGIPIADWPEAAREYPVDDVVGALRVAEAQRAYAAAHGGGNLHMMPETARHAWGLHLSALWGLRTDPATVAEVSEQIEATHRATLERYTAAGIYRPDGTRDTAALARMVALAYGSGKACEDCSGKGWEAPVCGYCGSTGRILKGRRSVKCPECTGGKGIKCFHCQGTGLDLAGVPRTERGGVQADRDAMKESGAELLEEYARAGENEKWYATYLPVLRAGTETPINPRINTLVVTGRSSYRKPNLQNLPRNGRVRECFAPRPGNYFASVDYGGLELATLAQVCLWTVGESRLAEALNAGLDVHDVTAADARGITYAEQHEAREAGDKTAKNFRQLSKATNFGLPGGLGAVKLVAFARQSYNARFCLLSGRADRNAAGEPTCGVEKIEDPRSGKRACARCVEVAKDLKAKWLATYPEVAEYHKAVSALTDGPLGGSVQVLGPVGAGRPGLGLVRGGCGFCDGSNLGFQGLAARGAKSALYAVAKEAYTDPRSLLWGTRPVVFIHDEILAEVPIARAHEAAIRISRVMIDTMRQFVPDVEITAPPALMRQWLKGAEPTFDAQGRLIPWEPPKK